jgi:cytochrome c-type biogenesis protein CcmH
VLALRAQGKDAQQILDAFVAKYGEKALMAPKAQGFNWLGYLVPGTAILLAGGVLLAVIGRRKASGAATDASGQPGGDPEAQVTASPEELERLRQALAEVED